MLSRNFFLVHTDCISHFPKTPSLFPHAVSTLPPPSQSLVTALEPLLGSLRLRRLDGRVRVRVREAAPQLPVLLGGRDAGAHADALAVVGAARDGRVAVGVGHAAARDELLALAVADVGGARVVGGDLREGGGGDCSRRAGLAFWWFGFWGVGGLTGEEGDDGEAEHFGGCLGRRLVDVVNEV